MLNIIVFGTGSSAESLFAKLDFNKINIKFLSDNNTSKHYLQYKGYLILPPEKIRETEFDYVFIASQYSIDILQQLLELGIPYNKIIPYDYANHSRLNMKFHEEAFQTVIKRKKTDNKKMKIAVTNYGYSHYNGYALYQNIPKYIKSKYQIDLITKKNVEVLQDYDVICSSCFDGIYDSNHINIEMWHGFPIKRMGNMHEELISDKYLNFQIKRSSAINLILSYSELYSTFFNSCYPNNITKYRVSGMPRNDLLFRENGLNKIEKICNKKIADCNIVFYLPTWRKNEHVVDSSKDWISLFGLSDESELEIINMLEEQNLFLVVKLHPVEYRKYKDLDIFKHERIHLLTEEALSSHEIHLYELLSSAKILITDYSSIFFDTLLIDTPVIFTPTDVTEYKKNRGFLLEPYDYLTPGPTVASIKELNVEIKAYLDGDDNYKKDRELVRKLVHRYTDSNSSLRVWEEIDNYLSNL
ncbi:CDP-glycerol glycerophosphotransferase family protein [Paenibacillus sp. MER TA 81-3]|uniref:CDP-glycerol glycerophosphotransferase family protein n=1 Tax=Paenibacillus sp. MER TA 81-3 TaxID=2939573 RepID=UPI00203D1F57|nr:CDP-glycerol glycerophosphotransferase family protein [Paenibacillus sp. MER TA 81-3]MCM3338744.1 CDP-glycerol glycerophosphotransferase family protein [Paenibacillus sp. MER TA 81-3]